MNDFEMTHDFLTSHYNYHSDGFLICKRRNVRVGSFDKTCGYYKVLIRKKTFRVHRLIFLFHYGYLPEMVDHINGDISDNRIENLQCADSSINSLKKIGKTRFSPIEPDKVMNRFVSYKKDHKKYCIEYYDNGKKINYGYFDNLDIANNVSLSILEERISCMDNYGINVRIPEVV